MVTTNMPNSFTLCHLATKYGSFNTTELPPTPKAKFKETVNYAMMSLFIIVVVNIHFSCAGEIKKRLFKEKYCLFYLKYGYTLIK